MTHLRRRRLHVGTFVVAGFYNLAWGTLTALSPLWFFQSVGVEPPKYPEIFACLGMVIGLYGILYFKVATDPESQWLIAAVGLVGKVLGPIGFVTLVLDGKWPLKSFVLILLNDVVWWVPFSLYLFDVLATQRARNADSTTSAELSSLNPRP